MSKRDGGPRSRRSTSRRSSATPRSWPRAADGAQLCAVVKADGYGHGAVPAARAALRGRRDVAGGRDGAGGARAARGRASTRARARDGRAAATRSCRSRSTRGADVVAWRDELRRARWPRSAARRGCTSSSTPAWAGSARATPREADAASPSVAAAPTPRARRRLMTHFATADERGDALLRRAARALPGVGRAAARRATPACSLHAANSAATLRDAAPPLRPRALRHRDLRPGPVRRGPGRRATSSRRSSCAPTSPRSSRSRPGRARATGGASSPSETTRSRRSRSATATAARRALTNNADVLIGGRRLPLVGTVSMDNVTVDLGAAARRRASATRSVLIGAQGDERITRRGRRAAAGHDQLRDHLRAHRARPARVPPRRRAGAERAVECGAGGRARRARAASAAWVVGGAVRDRLLGAARSGRPRPRRRRRRRAAAGARARRARPGGAGVRALGRVRRLARHRARPRAGRSTSRRCTGRLDGRGPRARATSPSTRSPSRWPAASSSTRTAARADLAARRAADGRAGGASTTTRCGSLRLARLRLRAGPRARRRRRVAAAARRARRGIAGVAAERVFAELKRDRRRRPRARAASALDGRARA